MSYYEEPRRHTGAREASYESGARKLLRQFRRDNPEGTFKEFMALVDDHDDGEQMREAMHLNWYANNDRYLARDPALARDRASEREKVEERIEVKAKEGAAKTIEPLIFLGTPMPNGKALRYNTIKEAHSFGGLLLKLKGEPKQRVGEVYRTDAEILKLYRR